MVVPGNGVEGAAKGGLILLGAMDQEGTMGVSAVTAFLIHGMPVRCSRMQHAAICFLNRRWRSPYWWFCGFWFFSPSFVASHSFKEQGLCGGGDPAP